MLYLVATPIGNLEDITYRAVRVLQQVDAVFAEDTRRTIALLNHLGIKKPLHSCHEHNERDRSVQIVSMLREGKDIALVSDAGLPGISDPGAVIVRAAIEAGQELTVLPGACAATTALVLSGLPSERFAFEGFLPRDTKARGERIAALAAEMRTAILYESPLRLPKTLSLLAASMGDRPAAVCRELTKMHESCIRGTLSELAAHFADAPKGECVIVLQGASALASDAPSLESLLDCMDALVQSGQRVKAAAKALANPNFPASELYARYIARAEHRED